MKRFVIDIPWRRGVYGFWSHETRGCVVKAPTTREIKREVVLQYRGQGERYPLPAFNNGGNGNSQRGLQGRKYREEHAVEHAQL